VTMGLDGRRDPRVTFQTPLMVDRLRG